MTLSISIKNLIFYLYVLLFSSTGLNTSSFGFDVVEGVWVSIFKFGFPIVGVLAVYSIFNLRSLSHDSVKIFPNVHFLLLLVYVCVGTLIFSSVQDFELLSFVNAVFHIVSAFVLTLFVNYMSATVVVSALRKVIYINSIFMVFVAVSYYSRLDVFSDFYSLDDTSALPRFSGLATEPSHAAFIILMSYFGLLAVKARVGLFTHLLIFVSLLLTQSTFGYVIYILILIYIIDFSGKYSAIKVACLILALLAISVADGVFQLISSIFFKLDGLSDAIFTLDAGQSRFGQNRLWVFFSLVQNYQNFNIVNLFVGHGVGSGRAYVSDLTNQILEDGQFGTYLYEFGLVGVFFLLWLYKKISSGLPAWFSFPFILMLVFNANISTQMFWYVLFVIWFVTLESLRLRVIRPET